MKSSIFNLIITGCQLSQVVDVTSLRPTLNQNFNPKVVPEIMFPTLPIPFFLTSKCVGGFSMISPDMIPRTDEVAMMKANNH
jgi:hypothetical protein